MTGEACAAFVDAGFWLGASGGFIAGMGTVGAILMWFKP